MMRHAKGSISGFTLIELMVTLGVFVALGAVVLINLAGRRTTTDLTDTSAQIVATLREAQSDAMAQKNGVVWGVHFSNPATTTAFYALFSGSYATGTVIGQYTLPYDIQYASSSVAAGNSSDITFAQVTGIPSTSTAITIDLVSGFTSGGSSTSSGSLSRQSSGKVFFDNFNRSSL